MTSQTRHFYATRRHRAKGLAALLASASLLGALLPAHAQTGAANSPQTQATAVQQNGRGIARAPDKTPEGLACRMPTVWVSERINQPYPRTPIAVDERAVYTGADNLYALDKKTGAVLWHYDFPNANFDMALSRYGVNGLAVDANSVYFGGYAGTLVALNKRNGQLRWKMDDVYPGEQIAVAGNRLYFGNGRQTYALDKTSGKVLWTESYGKSLEIANNMLFSVRLENIYAANVQTGKELWHNQLKGTVEEVGYFDSIHSLPYVYNNQVMAYTTLNVMYGFDAKTGALLWQFDGFLDGRARALMGRGDTVIFYSPTGRLAQYNLKTRQVQWWFRLSSGSVLMPPVYYKGLILLGNESNALIALDYATGKEVFRHELDEDLRAVRAMVVQGDMLYLNSIDGKVHALRLECPQLKGREGFR